VTSTANVRPFSPERLAYWYFRLNGFLTTENFVIHDDTTSDPRTDADLFAVRFASRQENLEDPMVDDPVVSSCKTYANVIIAEVKRPQCSINKPWTDSAKGNMLRALRALGCVAETALGRACEGLYERGIWSDSIVTVRLFVIGETRSEELIIPAGQQVTWSQVLDFIVDRFKLYNRQKRCVDQWKDDGKKLKQAALSRNPNQAIRVLFGLRTIVENAKGGAR
jgi:hypothetical protein